jgi:RNase adapter protein RapZ
MNDNPIVHPLPAGVPLIIITGLSGAGKSQAMRFLEDLGCFCVDNLPPALIPTFFHLCEQSQVTGAGVAIVSDVRSGALFRDFTETIDMLKMDGVQHELLYLDGSTDTLIRRFKEVRRNHPLQASGLSMEAAIEEERQRLIPIREIADQIVDTSELTSTAFRNVLVQNLFSEEAAKAVKIHILSFGFKYGTPRDVDFVFDVRFLPNPFYDPALTHQTGEDEAVYDFVMSPPVSDEFFSKTVSLLECTLDPFVEKGKTNVSIGIGCTGGRHRSVAFAKRLDNYFKQKGIGASLSHRDMTKPQQ